MARLVFLVVALKCRRAPELLVHTILRRGKGHCILVMVFIRPQLNRLAQTSKGAFAKVSFEIAQGRHGSASSVTSTDIA